MSDYDRRSYGPGVEPPLTFDDRRRERARGPAPVTLIVSLLFLVAAAGGVFYLYRSGTRGPNDAPQPVGAPLRDVRTLAPPQPQASDPAAGLSIYKSDPDAASAAPAFVPPPEQPTARPAPALAAAVPSPEPAQAEPAPPAAPAQIAVKPKTAPPPAKPASIDKLLADAGVAAHPKPTAAVAAAASEPAAKSGPASVQIGAFSSQSLADAGWNDAAGLSPGAMAGKAKKVVPMTRDDGSTLYRTSITGFASREDAQALCDRLKAAGKTCFVR